MRFFMSRRTTLVIAVVLFSASLVFSTPSVRAQGGAVLVPPHSDVGVDTDGDSAYDFLEVTVGVNASVSGFYLISVLLRDITNMTFITGETEGRTLSGPGSVVVRLSGRMIYTSGIDGPYFATIELWDGSYVLEDSGNHTTGGYAFTDFDRPELTFAPPHADAALDTDADGLFDVLRVRAQVNVSEAGSFQISGDLLLLFSGDSDAQSVTLPVGLQFVDLEFAGWRIRGAGWDGPYIVNLQAFLEPSFTFLGFGNHTTGAYLASSFEEPPATFAPPHGESLVDTDGDGKANRIAIDVSLQVREANWYLISGELRGFGGTSLAFVSEDSPLTVGTHSIRIQFSTLPLVAGSVNGPYTVILTLFAPEGRVISSAVHDTLAYTVAQFDVPGAAFAPLHTDALVDKDSPPDGLANALGIGVVVAVTEAGTYGINAQLSDSGRTTLIATDGRAVTLTAGVHTVPVRFPGPLIRSAGIPGPYAVDLTLEMWDPLSFAEVTIDTDAYTTAPHGLAQFQDRVSANLVGTVTDAGTGLGIRRARVLLYNHLDEALLFGLAPASDGRYNMTAWEGDWVVLYNHGLYQSEAVRVTVAGPELTRDIALSPTVPNPVATDLILGSWESVTVRQELSRVADNRSFRLGTDWAYGNRDQFASDAEIEVRLSYFEEGRFADLTSQRLILVDGAAWDVVPGSNVYAPIGAAGSIDDSSFARFVKTTAYASPAPVPAASVHTVDVPARWDNVEVQLETNTYTVALPSGYVLDAFTAPAGVSVSGLGTEAVSVDPGPDPDPFDNGFGDFVTLVARDAAPPVIASATGSPDP